MAFGEGWFSAVPNVVWVVLHVVAALTGVFFWSRSRNDQLLSGAFVLFAVFGLLFALARFGVADAFAVYVVGSVVMLAALVLVGLHAQKSA